MSEEIIMQIAQLANCKGDWVIGTACGKCPKCFDNAPKAIEFLRAESRGYLMSLTAIAPILSAARATQSDTFRLACLDEIARLIHKE